MNNITVKLGTSFLLFLLWASFSFAQDRYDPRGVVRGQLMNLISVRFGPEFKSVGFSIFDSLIFHSQNESKHIQDPYKTLKGCVLFSTYKDNGDGLPDNFIAGMVKNGQIVWDNAPGTSADLGGRLLSAQDINNDKEVDLLISESDREFALTRRGPFLYYLYILSWDGIRGRFINAFDSSGTSVMVGDGDFVLVNKDGDNIKEIHATLPDIDMDWGDHKTTAFPHITYTWNGSKYGLWVSARKISKSVKQNK